MAPAHVILNVERRIAWWLGTVLVLLLVACSGAPASAPASAREAPTGPAAAKPSASASTVAKPAASGAGTKITVVYNSPDAGYLALWVGQDAGIFRKNGIDLDPQLVSNAQQSFAALLSGQVQFIQSGASAALSPWLDGANLTILTVMIPVYSYLLEANASIKTPADLKGQKLGVSSLGDSSDLATRVALRKVGLDPDKDVTILAVGGTPVRAAALRNGAIQAAVASFPENLALEKDGFNRLVDFAALKVPAAAQGTIADRGWVSGHKDVTQSYVDSLVESLARIRNDKPFALATMKKWMKTDDDATVNVTYDYYTQEVFPALPEPKPELFTDAVAQVSKTNDKAANMDLSKLLDGSFVAAAKSKAG